MNKGTQFLRDRCYRARGKVYSEKRSTRTQTQQTEVARVGVVCLKLKHGRNMQRQSLRYYLGKGKTQSKPRHMSIAERKRGFSSCSYARASSLPLTQWNTSPQRKNSQGKLFPKRKAMTEWCAIASDMLCVRDPKLAVCCIAVGIVCLLAWHVKNCCFTQRHPVHAARGRESSNGKGKHTHWTRRLPGKYTYLTWGMAVISASLCASTKQIDFLFAVNLFTCVFACQAQRALASARLRSGWVRKARRVGKARVKARRQQGRQPCRAQVLIAAILLLSPGCMLCAETVRRGRIARQLVFGDVWCTARKLRNQLMRAMHGNTMERSNKRQAEACRGNQFSDTNAESANLAHKKPKVSHGRDAITPLQAEPNAASWAAEKEADEDMQLDMLAQARIGCELIKVPGDGWCFFHAVLRHCRGWQSWSVPQAAKLYLQALEWMCNQKHGPRADEVAIASVPFDDREAALHQRFLQQAKQLQVAEGLTEAETVLWSKVVAVLEKPRMLDSIHHGSAVELWALTQAFDFHCLIWSHEDDRNIWIHDMAYITDAEAEVKLQEHSHVLELLHRNIGITGHYDLVQRSEGLREPFPETPWLQTWRTEGSEAVLCLAAERMQAPVELPPVPPPSEPPRAEYKSVVSDSRATEQAQQPTTCQASRSHHMHETTKAVEEAADDGWAGRADAEESEGAVTDVDCDSLLSWDSNQSESSNEADLQVTVDPNKTWVTVEDRDQERIRQIAVQLRQHPLLPSPAAMSELPTTRPNSGIVYPAVHCAFEACRWASDRQPCHPHWSKEKVWHMKETTWVHTTLKCCGNDVVCLWAHLHECHLEHFADIPPELVASKYTAALVEKENGHVPQVGWSVDRRTLRRLQVDLDDDSCQALICACCARVAAGGTGGEIGYISVQHLFGALSPEAAKANWSLESYMTQYGTVASVTKRLQASEWSRTLPEAICEGMQLLCCPEDFRCKHCTQGSLQLCEACEVPLCRKCLENMCKQNACAVPEALANDNWCGYPTELLYTHKVRWIEAAAASPVWTSVINYYVEADRGNLIEEHLHRPEHRTAIRGNVSSFSIPWEEVLTALAPDTQRATTWEKLPHPPQVLQAIVKINVKGMLYNEAIEWVAGARIRPWVVVALLHHLIDLQHPMCSSPLSADDAKAAVTQRVTVTYGVEETGPLVEMKNAPSPAMKSEASEGSKPKLGKARTVTKAGAKKMSQSSAQAAAGVATEPAASVTTVVTASLASPSMCQPASELESKEASTVSKGCPQMTSQSGDQPTMHAMQALSGNEMEAGKISQSSAQAAAEVPAEPIWSQKQLVPATTPSQSRSQPASAKPPQDASPGDNLSPQMTIQSSAQASNSTASVQDMVSTSRRLSETPSAPLSPSRTFLAASAEVNQQPPQKHATPETGAETALDGQSFIGSVRPNVLSQDYTGAEWKDPDVDMLLQLSNATDTLTIRTGHNFWDQWQNDFLPWAFPFSIPAPVSGPDFPHKARPRRPEEAPHLQPLAHLKLLAGRIESSIRNSWDLIPGLRRLTFKWYSVWQGSLWRKWKSQRQAIAPVPTLKWVQAARGLYNKLRSGTYITAGGKPKPIHFDTRKLPYARGLTTDEKE